MRPLYPPPVLTTDQRWCQACEVLAHEDRCWLCGEPMTEPPRWLPHMPGSVKPREPES